MFIFSPEIGEMIQFDECILQMRGSTISKKNNEILRPRTVCQLQSFFVVVYVSCIFHACFMMCVYVSLWFSDTFRRNFGDPRSYKTFGIRAASPVFFWTLLSKSWTKAGSRVYLYIPQWLSNFLLSMHTCFRYSISYVHIYIYCLNVYMNV